MSGGSRAGSDDNSSGGTDRRTSDTSSPSCPVGENDLECSSNGTCSDGTCACRADYSGAACETICQFCYGAIGNNCGPQDGWEVLGENVGLCVGLPSSDTASCMINVGSWTHDECCIEHRQNGLSDVQGDCSGPFPEVCVSEFNLAVADIGLGLTWTRFDVESKVGRCTTDTVEVDFLAMCAPTGSTMRCSDSNRYCCSGSSRRVIPEGPFIERCTCD